MKSIAWLSRFSVLVGFLMACSSKPLPKTFLVPSGYEGTMRIVYEEESAVKSKIESGRQIFEFPENGILILDNDLDGGIGDEFYLVSKTGERKKITEVSNLNDGLRQRPAVLIGMETVSGFTYSNNVAVVQGLVFKDCYLFNKNTPELAEPSPRFDSLTKSVVQAFRKRSESHR
jgi:hypothetical protein